MRQQLQALVEVLIRAANHIHSGHSLDLLSTCTVGICQKNVAAIDGAQKILARPEETRPNVIGAKPVCLDCHGVGLRNCSHFDECDGTWVYKPAPVTLSEEQVRYIMFKNGNWVPEKSGRYENTMAEFDFKAIAADFNALLASKPAAKETGNG